MMKQIKYIFTALLVLSTGWLTAQTHYTPIDAGSKVHFVIKNFGIKTGGDFTGLKGSIVFDPANVSASKIAVTVDAGTIDTDNNARDGHLKKEEYFDVAHYPQIAITANRIGITTISGRYFFTGTVTIKGVTKPIDFGFTVVPSGNDWLFQGEFELNRRDFNVGGNSFSLQDKLKVQLKVLARKG